MQEMVVIIIITFITTAISIITITVINCPLLHFY